jgi:hypothetical protein
MKCFLQTFLKNQILGFVAWSVLVGNVGSQQILSLGSEIQSFLHQCKNLTLKHSCHETTYFIQFVAKKTGNEDAIQGPHSAGLDCY